MSSYADNIRQTGTGSVAHRMWHGFSTRGRIRGKLAQRLLAAATLAALCTACAQPKGELFPAINPARVWPRPPDQPRIKLIGTISDSADLKAPRSGMEVIAAVLRGPRPPIRFVGPHGIAVNPPATLAVTDAGGAAVHILNLERRTHVRITGLSEHERLRTPLGAAWVGPELFITDAKRHEVLVFDAGGRVRRAFGVDTLTRPVGITYVSDRNRLYVVDGDQHRIMVFDPSGAPAGTIGRRGADCGEFNYPSHIVARGNRMLVADSGNFRVQLLDLDGGCISTIGQKGNAAGDLSLPKGVAFDSEGHIYIVDAHFENVQLFDEQSRLLMAFGGEGSSLGEFSLPAGLAIDQQDRIWVADSRNRRVQVFQYLGNSL